MHRVKWRKHSLESTSSSSPSTTTTTGEHKHTTYSKSHFDGENTPSCHIWKYRDVTRATAFHFHFEEATNFFILMLLYKSPSIITVSSLVRLVLFISSSSYTHKYDRFFFNFVLFFFSLSAHPQVVAIFCTFSFPHPCSPWNFSSFLVSHGNYGRVCVCVCLRSWVHSSHPHVCFVKDCFNLFHILYTLHTHYAHTGSARVDGYTFFRYFIYSCVYIECCISFSQSFVIARWLLHTHIAI